VLVLFGAFTVSSAIDLAAIMSSLVNRDWTGQFQYTGPSMADMGPPPTYPPVELVTYTGTWVGDPRHEGTFFLGTDSGNESQPAVTATDVCRFMGMEKAPNQQEAARSQDTRDVQALRFNDKVVFHPRETCASDMCQPHQFGDLTVAEILGQKWEYNCNLVTLNDVTLCSVHYHAMANDSPALTFSVWDSIKCTYTGEDCVKNGGYTCWFGERRAPFGGLDYYREGHWVSDCCHCPHYLYDKMDSGRCYWLGIVDGHCSNARNGVQGSTQFSLMQDQCEKTCCEYCVESNNCEDPYGIWS